jgi:hypothetical protein
MSASAYNILWRKKPQIVVLKKLSVYKKKEVVRILDSAIKGY